MNYREQQFMNIKVGDIVCAIDKNSDNLEATFIKIEKIENQEEPICIGKNLENQDDSKFIVTKDTYLHNISSTSYIFMYTTDFDQAALDEIQLQVEDLGLIISNIEIFSSDRACRNAYGKEVNEEEFDSYDIDSDEMWFDDYDYVIQVDILDYLPDREDITEDTEISDYLSQKCHDYYGTLDEYLAELDEEYGRE